MTPQDMLGQFLCLMVAMILFVIAYRYLTRRPPGSGRVGEIDIPPVLCPNCGYDVRHTTDFCPECGQRVPENLRLRADLREGRLPAWLFDPEQALPPRQPSPEERWQVITAVSDLRQVRPLEALLDQAGIEHRSILTLMPRPNLMGLKRERPPPLAAVVEIPEDDLPLAFELALHVRRMHEQGELERLYEQLGLEVEEDEPERQSEEI